MRHQNTMAPVSAPERAGTTRIGLARLPAPLRAAAAALLGLAIATGSTGCATAGEGAFNGAALGALAGLGLGSLTGDAGKGAAAGAIIGGTTGAVIGDSNMRADQRARYGTHSHHHHHHSHHSHHYHRHSYHRTSRHYYYCR